jgi:hypothetical protein
MAELIGPKLGILGYGLLNTLFLESPVGLSDRVSNLRLLNL